MSKDGSSGTSLVRQKVSLITRAREHGKRITTPATALAQAIRSPAKQALLSQLIRQVYTDLMHVDGPGATAVGLLLSRTGTADIADAHVVVCAQRSRQPVVTSAPKDLRRIAPGLTLVIV